jgi:hypothetical protein
MQGFMDPRMPREVLDMPVLATGDDQYLIEKWSPSFFFRSTIPAGQPLLLKRVISLNQPVANSAGMPSRKPVAGYREAYVWDPFAGCAVIRRQPKVIDMKTLLEAPIIDLEFVLIRCISKPVIKCTGNDGHTTWEDSESTDATLANQMRTSNRSMSHYADSSAAA